MASSSNMMGPKCNWQSTAIFLVPKNNRSHGTDDACARRILRAIHASVGYNCAWFCRISVNTWWWQKFIPHLPPFNKICFLCHISLHSTKITAKFGGPAFVRIISKKGLTMLVKFRQNRCGGISGRSIDSGCSRWLIVIVLLHLFYIQLAWESTVNKWTSLPSSQQSSLPRLANHLHGHFLLQFWQLSYWDHPMRAWCMRACSMDEAL